MTAKVVRKAVAPKPTAIGPGNDSDFTHKFPDGVSVTVPSLSVAKKPNFDEFTSAQTIPDSFVRQAVVTRLFLIAACGDEWDTVKSYDLEEVSEFVNAWSEHSGVVLGEL
jgi:hypothetical protein